jgi:hypothetical protein
MPQATAMACPRIGEVAQVLAEFKRVQDEFKTQPSRGLTGEGGPSLDSRLDALARELAGAVDVITVLRVRDEVLKMVVDMRAAEKTRAQREVRRRARLRRRARALRLESELISGELLLSLKARGLLRTASGGDQKTEAGRSRMSRASVGFKSWATAQRWQARASAAPSRSFNVRLAEVSSLDGIRALVEEGTWRRNDHADARMRAIRKHGRALLLGDPCGR